MADFPDVQVGQVYEIISGLGEGSIGLCEDTKESGFGHKWGLVCGRWVRTNLLRPVEGDRPTDT